MNKKIVSFGDSFIFGTELSNNIDGHKAWPGQIAKQLNCEYYTNAVGGVGNDHIARQIYSYFSKNSSKNTLAIINWTWTHRWDFYIVTHEKWITLGLSCVPENLKKDIEETEAHCVVDFYNKYTNSSLIWNKFRNLQTISAVQLYLKTHNIKSIQTYMDYHLFDNTCHAPDYIQELQKLTQPNMEDFEGQNFIDWSRKQGFFVTDPGLHPLEDAHNSACILWKDRYAQALNI
jgi:hypothetical protein